MRINRFFSDQGFCSRREADRLIQAGRVKLNNKVAVLGDQVSESDSVSLDGKTILFNPPKLYIAYHKPLGITCTTDQTIAGNIIDAIKHKQRIYPIGRLDKDSTGLILLTNDGDIVNKILRAENGHEKEYHVEVNGPINDEFVRKMSAGVDIEDHFTRPCKIKQTGKNRFTIILTEGKNRQIRRMCEVFRFTVKHLKRVRVMNIQLGNLKEGQWRELTSSELQDLQGRL